MSSVNLFTKMLDKSGTKYTKDGTKSVKVVDRTGSYTIMFDEGGKHFRSASFVPSSKSTIYSSLKADDEVEDNDYHTLLDMISNSPAIEGECFEAATEDRKYIAVVFLGNDSDLYVAFVCNASDGGFAGMVWF